MHRWIAAPSLLLLLLVSSPVRALQGGGAGQSLAPPRAAPGDLVELHAYTFKYQAATEALPLVQPLLSRLGTVELQPGGNTLVVRDSAAALARILPLLRDFDHPVQAVRVEVLVVEASRTQFSPAPHNELPESLMKRLRGLLPYNSYRIVAQSGLAAREGEDVTYELGAGFGVSFRLGTVLAKSRLKLYDFRVLHGPAAAQRRQLLYTNLNLLLNQTLTLALASNESSNTALMVVLTPRVEAPAAGQTTEPR